MTIKPENMTLSASSVEILNNIRSNATENYRNFVPTASADTDSIKEIGAVIMQYDSLQNEFLTALVNRIGRVIITSKTFYNPWVMFKKGMLELGETVEEIFVNVAKPYLYNPEDAATTLYAREIPDVRAAFHVLNYQILYPTTVSQDQLRQAFLSWQGITDLVSKIIEALYTSANYDEFMVMKYLLAKHILNGRLYPSVISDATAENAQSIVSTVKGVSNTLEFMSDKYNMSGVKTHSPKRDQILLVDSKFDAIMDVNVLATAFNMDKAEFMGQRVLVDSFGTIDNARLALLFANKPNYTPLTNDQLAALNAIPAVLVDRDFFMVFDNLFQITDAYNSKGLYWNYFLHNWKTFSVSPFTNCIVFVPGTPSVTSVTVTPATATVATGQMLKCSVDVVTANYAPQTVTWSLTGNEVPETIVDLSGVVYIGANETAETVTVTATSTYDGTKTDTCVITVS